MFSKKCATAGMGKRYFKLLTAIGLGAAASAASAWPFFHLWVENGWPFSFAAARWELLFMLEQSCPKARHGANSSCKRRTNGRQRKQFGNRTITNKISVTSGELLQNNIKEQSESLEGNRMDEKRRIKNATLQLQRGGRTYTGHQR